MKVTEKEILDLQKFVAELNSQTGLVVVEGKRDSEALRDIGVSCKMVEFHRFGGMDDFADSVSKDPRIIVLLDGDRKGRYMTSKIIKKLERRTRVDLSFKKKLVRITGGRFRFIEELSVYQDVLK